MPLAAKFQILEGDNNHGSRTIMLQNLARFFLVQVANKNTAQFPQTMVIEDVRRSIPSMLMYG